MADKRGRVYDPIKGHANKRKQRSDPEKVKKMNALCRVWYENNKEEQKIYMRNHYFIKKFGITAAEKDQMILDCSGICTICLGEFKDRKDAHLDHDHETGKIRGVLCGSCNRKLGWFEKHKIRVDEYLTKR